jgi:hypothetical protein
MHTLVWIVDAGDQSLFKAAEEKIVAVDCKMNWMKMH